MYECAIVGGGIHGTSLAQRILEETSLERSDVVIVDPNARLLESFRRKSQACGMDALRSTFVHHVGTEPFGLETFAESRGREAELLPTAGYPRRPSLSLFLDYADYVIDSRDLESLRRQAAVTAVSEERQGLRLETSEEPIRTRTCVLAVGRAGCYRRPAWASGIDGISHVWDDAFDREERAGTTVVVGGGITAGQLAVRLAECESVTVLSRHPFERAVTEADPRWINWHYVEDHLHVHPPGSRARDETIRAARNDATMPPHLHDRLEDLLDSGRLSARRGNVTSARRVDGETRLLLAEGGCVIGDRVVLATGFDSCVETPLLTHLADDLGLERDYRGLPVLEDETLAWRRADATASPVFVSGWLAQGTVGPLAGTIVGARRSADRITAALEKQRLEPIRPA